MAPRKIWDFGRLGRKLWWNRVVTLFECPSSSPYIGWKMGPPNGGSFVLVSIKHLGGRCWSSREESLQLMAMTIWLLAQNSHSRDRFVARHNGWAVADHSWFSQWAKSYLLATLFNAIERPWSCPVFCSSQFINTFKRTERSSLDTWANDVDNRAKPFWTQPWKNGHIIKPQKAPRELSTVFEN